MKPKLLTLFIALTVAAWAQTSVPAAPLPTAPTEKAKCPCCEKMASADAKDVASRCAQHDMQSKDGKEAESCCGGKMAGGKDGMACMRNAKDKAASCCKENCGKECAKGKDKDKAASSGCGGSCCKDGNACCGSRSDKSAQACCRKTAHS